MCGNKHVGFGWQGGFSTTSPLLPAARAQLVASAGELEQALQAKMGNVKWHEVLPNPDSGAWRTPPRKLFDYWSQKSLPCFGLLKFLRNFFAHVGQLVNKGPSVEPTNTAQRPWSLSGTGICA